MKPTKLVVLLEKNLPLMAAAPSFPFFAFLVFFYSSFITVSSGDSIGSWCSKTPHPQLCDFYLERNQMPNHPTPQDRSDFRKMLLQATIDQAVTAQAQVTLISHY